MKKSRQQTAAQDAAFAASHQARVSTAPPAPLPLPPQAPVALPSQAAQPPATSQVPRVPADHKSGSPSTSAGSSMLQADPMPSRVQVSLQILFFHL
jgi:hypothetical protein